MTIWMALKFDVIPVFGNVGFQNWYNYLFKFDCVEIDKEIDRSWIDYMKNRFGFKIRLITFIEFGIGN
jgi:hypothetical protein